MTDPEERKSKIRRKDGNRNFNHEWTELYAFVLPEGKAKPMCLICCKYLSDFKKSNIRRHYTTKHSHFEQTYPQGTELRTLMIEQLKSQDSDAEQEESDGPQPVVKKEMTMQQKVMECSLRVAWVLGRQVKPFTDVQMIRECMCEISEALLEGKQLAEMKQVVMQIPLSNSTATRRTEMLTEDLVTQLYQGMVHAPCIALAMDELLDYTEDPHLLIFVRFYDQSKKVFIEDLLDMVNIGGLTVEDLHGSIKNRLKNQGIEMSSVVGVATNTVPAMLLEHMRSDNPDMVWYQCVVQHSMTAISLDNYYSEVVENIANLAGFLRSASCKEPAVSQFLENIANYTSEAINHTGIRWLNKCKILQQFWPIRNEVQSFLQQQMNSKANTYLEFVSDSYKMGTVAFLVDLISYIDDLSGKLQAENCTVCTQVSEIQKFRKKLEVWRDDLNADLAHFPTLREVIEGPSYYGKHKHVELIEILLQIFWECSNHFTIGEQVLLFLQNPFMITNFTQFSSEIKQMFRWVDPAVLQLELIELQGNLAIKHQLKDNDVTTLWTNTICPELCPQLHKVALHLLTIFGSTHCFKATFSTLTFIKNKCRYRINTERVQQCLRLAVTPLKPDFKALARSRQCHVSH